MVKRCDWCADLPLYREYHDVEWGTPHYHDQALFELLILESMQAGLSWLTILQKRQHFRQAFDNFNASKIATYTPKKIETLLTNTNIIRNRRKITSVITNAKAYLTIQANKGSFSSYIWDFVDGVPIQNCWQSSKHVPTTTALSEKMAKALKQIGFTFVGGTTCYAYMQATGMVNDHLVDCFRHQALVNQYHTDNTSHNNDPL